MNAYNPAVLAASSAHQRGNVPETHRMNLDRVLFLSLWRRHRALFSPKEFLFVPADHPNVLAKRR